MDGGFRKRLALAAVLMRSKNPLENVMTPRFYRALETLDTKDPVIREMARDAKLNHVTGLPAAAARRFFDDGFPN